ncbi:uncharacterized protein BP5553_00833 [Venustampulla echinocandica]|uniref:Zn(2)-C6 fungal-type domain-containing protein n=1 Tax=Venustampulla echinocandica TaxID=2656787 RepID=A0A370TZA7_9HELO|nr:uncharacterized protein BP5553_00833 [Venustampulla echinocandica]RDL40854.1 hypothetical protein BP5553_00833 [Venustampulla echinocandica]
MLNRSLVKVGRLESPGLAHHLLPETHNHPRNTHLLIHPNIAPTNDYELPNDESGQQSQGPSSISTKGATKLQRRGEVQECKWLLDLSFTQKEVIQTPIIRIYNIDLQLFRCDESGPECLVCRERGLQCAGFGALKPSWMDGGVQQEAVHQDIKATVASVTRMKRMMKLVKSREKVSPPLRSISIPSELLDSGRSSVSLPDNCSSGAPSRATSLGPVTSNSFQAQNPHEWTPEASFNWNLNNNFNMIPYNGGEDTTSISNLQDTSMEYNFHAQPFSTDGANCYLPPGTNPQEMFSYYTPDLVSYAPPYEVSGDAINYLVASHGPVLASSPAVSSSVPNCHLLPKRQCTPSQLQHVYSREGGTINGQIIQHNPNILETSQSNIPLSPVSEQSSLWAADTRTYTPASSPPQVQDLRLSSQIGIHPPFTGADSHAVKYSSMPIDRSAGTAKSGYRWP